MLDYDIRHGRTYMYFKGKPLFPFGYGLSYTSFKYSGLKASRDGDDFVFRFQLKNTGSRDGEEVVQLYATFQGDDAARRLRGFERIALKAGEQQTVEIRVPADDLKLWDSDAHAFAFKGRRAKIQIGASSADIRLKKKVKL
jgi:beta-glucosidase